MAASPILPHYQAWSQQLEPIYLDEMNRVELLNRVDTKYVLTERQLLHALQQVGDRYRILDVQGVRLNRYRSLYFDGPTFGMYLQHHNGKQNRYKVRFREYVDSELCFLEVKMKNSKQRTIKRRTQVTGMMTRLDTGAYEFLRDVYPFDATELAPKLWNHFIRITLVSKTAIERLTLDLHLSFRRNRMEVWLSDIAIAEVKQEKFSLQSDFVQQMRTLRLRPTGFSKYCIGAARLYPFLKQNRFKAKFLLMERLRNAERARLAEQATWPLEHATGSATP
jgi:hypothetical protein